MKYSVSNAAPDCGKSWRTIYSTEPSIATLRPRKSHSETEECVYPTLQWESITGVEVFPHTGYITHGKTMQQQLSMTSN